MTKNFKIYTDKKFQMTETTECGSVKSAGNQFILLREGSHWAMTGIQPA